jgi:hypothetical protein
MYAFLELSRMSTKNILASNISLIANMCKYIYAHLKYAVRLYIYTMYVPWDRGHVHNDVLFVIIDANQYNINMTNRVQLQSVNIMYWYHENCWAT